MRQLFSVVLMAVMPTVAFNGLAVTPMDQKIPEETITMIECEYTKVEPELIKSFEYEQVPGTYHYRVFLPPGYYAEEKQRYPCLFIASPGGNANMKNCAERMKRDKWIVVMLVESQNSDPRWGCSFLAAHDDAVARFRIQEGLKYGTGFSGGARCISADVGIRPGFSGMILQGAGFLYNNQGYILSAVRNNSTISIYMIVGNQDGNLQEVGRVEREIPPKTPFKAVTFPGPHSFAPVEEMDRAFDWMEERLIASDYCRKDPQFALLVFNRRMAALPNLPTNFEKYELLCRLRDMAAECKLNKLPDGKSRLDEIEPQIKTLQADPSLKKELTAKTNFDPVANAETKTRESFQKKPPSAKAMKKEFETLAKKYQQVADQFPDTFYGTKAKEKAAALTKAAAESGDK